MARVGETRDRASEHAGNDPLCDRVARFADVRALPSLRLLPEVADYGAAFLCRRAVRCVDRLAGGSQGLRLAFA